MAVAAPARPTETFPLVPRRRLHGPEVGAFRGVRRGLGSDPAGSRRYEPGDDVRTIDWGASARLTAARGADDFVVRERIAEQAPRIVVLEDRRPGMALYPEPWLSKAEAIAVCGDLIAESGFRARGAVGSLHFASGTVEWSAPTGNARAWRSRHRKTEFAAPPGSLAEGLERLGRMRSLQPGSFVFVLSDFLDPPPVEAWLVALGRGLDLVPVIAQDPTWEATFPAELGGLVLPLADPQSGRAGLVRLTRAEAAERRVGNAERLHRLVSSLAELGLDPVVVHSADRDAIHAAFLQWASGRLAAEGRAW
jgi:uncharacterized protein (DUF58 family)